ncbi:provicilin-like [Trifolium pratense]|uniref:provicilin-like n=1 Tax=Trifolium pratense TaxID=57577 RepID=UPI001E690D57|nr:provicilin-like [Trifolium pratense]
MAITIKSRFPLLLLLGIIFLASACASYEQRSPSNGVLNYHEGEERQPQRERGHQEGEKEEKHSGKWRPSYDWEEDEGEERQPQRERSRQEGEKEEERREKHSGKWRPSLDWEEDEGEERQPRRERSRQEGEKEEERREKHSGKWRPSHEWEEDEKKREDEEWRGSRRYEDPEERARLRYREERREKQQEKEWEKTDRRRRNPFFFRSNKFQTLFENENGHIRLLQRFDKRSNLFQNLQNYRLVEYKARPHAIFLPHHIDADFILVVLSGKAILTVLNPNNRNSFNLERGDTIKLPAGTTAYVVNQDDNEDLRIADLVIPINRPGKFQSFSPSRSQNQQSYFRGFSKNILEASFNARYEDIEKVLLEEEPQQRRGHKQRQQSQEADAIVRVSREQIEELRRHAKSSSKKSAASSESEPFNLRNRNPIYSNKFGKFFETNPEKSPQLKDLDISVSSVEINEGALLLPHYNSRAVVVLLVNEGKGNLELVGPNNEQQEQEEDEQQEQDEEGRQVQRYNARLSPGDVVVIPAGHPVAVSASSDLSLLGFGINAENNQRNFLAGEEDNVINQIQKPVKELTFPGSAQEVDRLIRNQKQSYFANARPQQRRGQILSSILGAFY